MRHALGWFLVVVVGGALVACGDDGGNRTPPETELDTVPAAISRETHVAITFHAAGNANGFVCRLDGATPSQCIPPFEADVTDGMHTFEVAAALNNVVDETPASYTWRVDATVPETVLVMGPPALDNTINPALTFTGSDPGGGAVTFECKLDGGAFSACTTPDQVNVTDGAHTFTVRAVDVARNVDPTPASHTWAVDTSTPDTTIVSGPAAGATTQPDVAFAFSSPETTATFECQLDSGAFAACTSPRPYAALTDGAHTFTVRAKNAAGTVDPTPATRTWTVDGTAPTVTITTTPTNPSNDPTPSFGFTSADATATFECQIDASAFVACSSPFTATTLAEGAHTFGVRGTDPVGNVGATATYAWVIDLTPPVITITSTPASPTASRTGTFTFTVSEGSPTCKLDAGAFVACTSGVSYTSLADGSHMFTVQAADALGNVGMAAYTWTIDGTPPVVTITGSPPNPSASHTGTFTFTVSEGSPTCKVDAGAFAACASGISYSSLADGSHTFTVQSVDALGNVGAANYTWVIDTTPPTVTIVTKPANPTASRTGTFTFTVSEGSPTCKLDAGAFVACTSGVSYSALADGSHTFTVLASDALGNVGSATYTWVVDGTPPVVAITGTPTNPSASSTATFTFTVSEGSPTCKLDAGAFVACASGVAYPGLADGSHTFTVQASDALGNTGSATYTWVVDTTPPVVTITGTPPNPSTSPIGTFTFTVSEGSPQCKLDAGMFAACTSGISYTALADGNHTFTVRSADALGNTASATYTWVIDATGPVITFDSVPPASWPVNYFDMQWHANESATFECSLNGAAFSACAPGLTISTAYNVASTFTVRGKDTLGNLGMPASTSWTSSDGLVLHYPWEQGSTRNTSLLAQVPAYSPDGSAILPVVGGWAGTAAHSPPAHTYPRTARPLTSSATGSYTASAWVRLTASNADGLLWSNANGTSGGHRVRLSNTTVFLEAFEGNLTYTVQGALPLDQWASVAVRTTGPAKGLQLVINGTVVGTASLPTQTGFDANQASDLTFGSTFGADVDDLRFYNVALTGNAACTTLVRGVFDAQGACVPMRPGFELDFEGSRLVNSGTYPLSIGPPTVWTPFLDKLGEGLKMGAGQNGLNFTKFSAVAPLPGHSLALWVQGASTADTLLDFTRPCSFVANLGTCGISIVFTAQKRLQVFTGTGLAVQTTTTVPANPLSNQFHSFVLAEQKSGAVTTSVKLYVDGQLATTVPIGTGDLFGIVADKITMVSADGAAVDEYELWPRDVSASREILCENGFDGEWNPAAGTCSLTSN